MRLSERAKKAIIGKIDQCAAAIDCLPDFHGIMVRVSWVKKNGKILKRVFLSPDSETEEEEDMR